MLTWFMITSYAYEGLHYLVATLFFAVQIYCDFSGYTDIARGTCQDDGHQFNGEFQVALFVHIHP